MVGGSSRNPEQQVIGELRESLDRLIQETHQQTLSAPRRRKLESQIRETIDALSILLGELDPIRQPASMFDPSNPKVVGRFVALALVAQDRSPLGEIPPVYGSGVYAIYYTGDNPLFSAIAGTETPIYVGQAAPSTGHARTPIEQGNKLAIRLNEHRRNIVRAGESVNLEDFQFRMLVVQSGWESAAEDYLIHLFRPVWNNEIGILYGFGKHGDSANTRANKRSPWDTAHPGREWAAHASLVNAKPMSQIIQEVHEHYRRNPVFQDLGSVLDSFVEELRQI